MTDRRARVLCLGAAVLDTVFVVTDLPKQGGKYLPHDAFQFAGGMASSAAASIARLGGEVELVANVGDDDAGRRFVAELISEGVDCSQVLIRSGLRTAFSTTLVDRRGERMVVPFYDPALRQAAEGLSFDGLERFGAILTDVRWPVAAAPLLEHARKRGIPTVLDADVAPLEILRELAPLAQYPVFSEPAALLLSECGTITDALAMLTARLGGFVAVTAGAAGTFYCEAPGGPVIRRPSPKVAVLDTLSAGDVYHGAFALAIAEGRDVHAAIDRANAAAAFKCTRRGGRLGAPTLAELEVFLQEKCRDDNRRLSG